MQTVKVKASNNYEINIGSGLLSAPPASFTERISGRKVMVVSDDVVFSLYGNKFVKQVSEIAEKTESFVFLNGEKSKSLSTYQKLVEKMYSAGIDRSGLVIALGGGVVGDLAGFAAATYQRGIDYIQVPTTLLAAVDSSVGGKTALDLARGKNQIGAFHQPVQVLCDIDFLKTLPEDEYKNGCAEIIKYAMIGSEKLFRSIQEVPIAGQYEDVITECVSMKRDVVEQDEFDRGMRMLLNFGHTFGHAVEACSRYKVPHGKAVAIGMAVVTKAAVSMEICGEDTLTQLLSVLNKYKLPSDTDYSAKSLADAMLRDKKGQGDKLTVVVPQKTGVCVLKEIKKKDIMLWLNAGGIR